MASIHKYGLKWDDMDPMDIERHCIRKGGKWKGSGGKEYGLGLFHHYRTLESLLWPEDYHNRWTDWMLRLLLEETICVFGACKDCVSGDTRIPNPITGELPTIRELAESGTAPTVMTFCGPKLASIPFVHGEGDLVEVVLENGSRFVGSRKHVVLTAQGFDFVESLYLGQAICSAAPMSQGSISELYPSVRVSNGLSWYGTIPNYSLSCRRELGFCDEQLLSAKGIDQSFSPSQDGARAHSLPYWQRDALDNARECIRSYQLFGHPSNVGFAFPETFSEMDGQCLGVSKNYERRFGPHQLPLQYERSFGPHASFSGLDPYFGRKHSQYVGSCIDYGLSLCKVQSIKPAGYGKFYDLTVPDAVHYFSEGAIHHNSGKTRRVSKWALMDYWCFPDNTLTVMTSTTNRGLELRVWGDIKSLWKRANDKYPWLEGNPSDSKHGIFTDGLGDDVKIRDMRKGIIGVPTMNSEESYDGAALNEFVGIKQGRRRLIGDEMQYIPADYLKVIYAMNAGDFKGAFLGNMIAENGKALDRVAEPEGGWGTEGEIKTSTQWRNKYGGVTLNMIGTDSPNLDPATKNKFPGMMTQDSIDRALKLPGAKDSVEWWSQILGIRKIGVISDRVFLVSDVTNNGGFKDVIWSSTPQKGLAIDAGFGGDDCVKTYFEFGEEVSGRMVIAFQEQSVYPVAISSAVTPEDQIAELAKADCIKYDIPYENVYIEAGMRATLAVSFGRILSPSINAINFGGTSTERPVSNDLFVFDEKTQQRRLKTCYEHYSKFVTELAFAVRDLVMCGQARLFPMPAAEEFQKRRWEFVYGDRYELETKVEYKERNASKSPNFSDSIMIAVEGAKRLGFQIERSNLDEVLTPTVSVKDANGNIVELILPNQKPKKPADQWLNEEVEAQRAFDNRHQLTYE